ncbi:DNAJC15, partial [Cervus elaphus hippelaphus]
MAPRVGFAPAGEGLRYAGSLQHPAQPSDADLDRGLSFSSYYRGGFEQKMSRREASLILGVSPSASKAKIRAAHRRIMILNHPDKGGTVPSTNALHLAQHPLNKGLWQPGGFASSGVDETRQHQASLVMERQPKGHVLLAPERRTFHTEGNCTVAVNAGELQVLFSRSWLTNATVNTLISCKVKKQKQEWIMKCEASPKFMQKGNLLLVMGSGFIYNREMLGVWCCSLTPLSQILMSAGAKQPKG